MITTQRFKFMSLYYPHITCMIYLIIPICTISHLCTTVTIKYIRCYVPISMQHNFHSLIRHPHPNLYFITYNPRMYLFLWTICYYVYVHTPLEYYVDKCIYWVSLAHYCETKCTWKLGLYNMWLNKWLLRGWVCKVLLFFL